MVRRSSAGAALRFGEKAEVGNQEGLGLKNEAGPRKNKRKTAGLNLQRRTVGSAVERREDYENIRDAGEVFTGSIEEGQC